MRVAEQDAWKIVFKTKQGLFEWLVMSFWICNASKTFMHVMNDVFSVGKCLTYSVMISIDGNYNSEDGRIRMGIDGQTRTT
jgi:hypothetical protein